MRVLARVLNVLLLTSEETLYRYRVRWLTFLISLDGILSPERFASRIEPSYVISSLSPPDRRYGETMFSSSSVCPSVRVSVRPSVNA